MAIPIKLKRSAVQGKVPGTADLDLGEIAINTYDGKLFIKKDDGSESIVEIGAGGGTTINELNDIGDVTITNVQTDDYLKWDGTAWINATPETLTIDDLSDVDTTTNLPDAYSILVWDASKNLWVPGSYVAREFDFDATSGQTDFTVTGVVFDKARVYTNGVRDRSTTFTITNNGSDTTVSFDTGKNSGDWVLIEI